MTTPNHPEDFLLRFTGRLPEEHQVPAAMLMQALQGMQRAVHLLAMEQEGREVRQRDRISRDLERKYVLLCSPPMSGSLAIAVRIGDPSSDLFAPEAIRTVAEKFQEVANALVADGSSRITQVLPDRIRRKRVLDALRLMIPKRGSGIELELGRLDGTPLFSTTQLAPRIEEVLALPQKEEAVRTVTGRLSRIFFDQRKLTIVYPATNRELDCFYREEVEDMLLENPRELIQVTGTVILDEEDNPKEITDVESIREVDLSPILLDTFNVGNRVLRFRKPFEAQPELDETQQLLVLRWESLGIHVFSSTREELLQELPVELDVLWRGYVLERQENLTPAALILRSALLENLEEVPDAKG